MGEDGVLLVTKDLINQSITYKHFRAAVIDPIKLINVTGAGDTLISTVVAGLLKQYTIEESVQFGIKAASLSVQSESAIPHNLSPASVNF